MTNKLTSFTFTKKPYGFVPGKAAFLDGFKVDLLPEKAFRGMAIIFEKLKVHNQALYERAFNLEKSSSGIGFGKPSIFST